MTKPYERGDQVEVLVGSFAGLEYQWVTGIVLSCEKPTHAVRWVLEVAIGTSINHAYTCGRIYCNADGYGEEVKPHILHPAMASC